ncbi:MAG TPA: histidine--tRNA ligase [Bacteroidia bacterium]|nr:histidine--tRNA ligase [Bacteroidia bacterium]
MTKPSIPKGTRDFSPVEMVRRNYILDTIRKVYQKYGYQQIETPAMENLTTLTGKYGEEGDQLLFKILNSRIHESKDKNLLLAEFQRSLDKSTNSETLTERALRYDLTVPFARYVVMHQNEITFPFKRYQVQPVWRADRPQKGRYREFYQCDADVIGSNSLLNEVELIQIMDEVFGELRIPVTIKMNNRKILSGIAEIIGEADKIIDITVAIDKLDKIGAAKVKEELLAKGLSASAIERIQPLIDFKGNSQEKINFLKNLLSASETGLKGVSEIEEVFEFVNISNLELDITLARGLNYYTGAIFEVKANNVQIGSITGGGRYDDLTGIFGLPGVSGVGISFGIDRIYDVLEELNMFETLDLKQAGTQVMFVNFGKEEEKYCLGLVNKIRKAGINAELFPDASKMKKQMAYADAKKIPFEVLVGSEEMNSGILTVKNMVSGEQSKLPFEQLVIALS